MTGFGSFYQFRATSATKSRLFPVGISQAVGKVHDTFSI
jgi:hypothetical protein